MLKGDFRNSGLNLPLLLIFFLLGFLNNLLGLFNVLNPEFLEQKCLGFLPFNFQFSGLLESLVYHKFPTRDLGRPSFEQTLLGFLCYGKVGQLEMRFTPLGLIFTFH